VTSFVAGSRQPAYNDPDTVADHAYRMPEPSLNVATEGGYVSAAGAISVRNERVGM